MQLINVAAWAWVVDAFAEISWGSSTPTKHPRLQPLLALVAGHILEMSVALTKGISVWPVRVAAE